MDARPFSFRQEKLLEQGAALWPARSTLLAMESDVQGGMHWKTSGAREYLVRYWTDPSTGLKKSKSLGRRSEASEQLLSSFLDNRAQFNDRRSQLDTQLSIWTNNARQAELGRLSPFVSSLYREFHRAGLKGIRLIDREAWLPQSVALEAELIGVPVIDHFDLGRRATVVLVPTDVDVDEVAEAAVRSGQGLERSGHMILGGEGTRIVAMLIRLPQLVGWAAHHGGEDAGLALLHCLRAPHVYAVVPDAEDLPLLVSAIPPASSALMAFCATNAMHIERHDVVELYAAGLTELLVQRGDELMLRVLDDLPELADRLQIGGERGFRI